MPFGWGRIAVAALASALVVAGVAVAAGGGAGRGFGGGPFGKGGDQGRSGRGQRPGPPPYLRHMTYAEIHVRQDGEDVVIRVDRGEVKSIAEDSVTITENDGSDVTIATDGETRVLVARRRRAALSDLKVGHRVTVDRRAGEAARSIIVHLKPGQRPGGRPDDDLGGGPGDGSGGGPGDGPGGGPSDPGPDADYDSPA